MDICNYHNNILLLYSSREIYSYWKNFFEASSISGIKIYFFNTFLDFTDNIYSLTAKPVKYTNEMYNKHGLDIWTMKILTQEWEK